MKEVDLLGVTLVLLLHCGSVHGAERYLSVTGSDTNPGTLTKPWKSLQRAVWKMKAGDELIVRGGTYRDSSFGDLEVPSKGKITIVRPYKGEKVIFDGRLSSVDALRSAWMKESKRRWKANTNPEARRLDGLWLNGKYLTRAKKIEELSAEKWFFYNKSHEVILELNSDEDPNLASIEFRLHSMLELDTPFWLIEGITAQYYNYAGFTISSTHHITIRNCDAHRNGGSGIEADESTDLLIEDNRTSYNGVDGGPGWASGIHLWKTTSRKNVVRRNTSHHNWDPSNHHTDGNGFSIDRGGKEGGAEVYDNVAYENGGRGIDVVEVANVKVRNNQFYSNSRDPLIQDQGEVSIAEAVSSIGFQMDNNVLKAVGTNPPLVLFGNVAPASLEGKGNVFCNQDSPQISIAIYGKKTFSPDEWRKLHGEKLQFSSSCPK